MGRVLVAIVWFSAGIAKELYGGISWVTSHNLSKLLKLHQMDYYFVAPKLPWLNRFIASKPRLCSMLALGTVILELGFPLALFDQRAAMVLVPSTLMILTGFTLAQGPLFLPLFSLTFLLWFPYASS